MTTALAPSRAQTALKTTVAVAFTLALLIGLPWLLINMSGTPWSWTFPEPARLDIALSWPPSANTIQWVLVLAAWALWLWLIARLAWEIAAQLAGRRSTSPVKGPIRLLAAVLTGTITATAPAIATAAAPETVVAAPATYAAATEPGGSQSADDLPGSDDELERTPEGDIIATVDSDDDHRTLWDMANKYYGDPTLYPKIFRANQGVEQADGRTLTHPDWIYTGWKLTIPGTAPAVEPDTSTPPASEPEPPAPEQTEPAPPPESEAPAPSTDTDPPVNTAEQGDTAASAPALSRGSWISVGSFVALSVLGVIIARLRKQKHGKQAHDEPKPLRDNESEPEPAEDEGIQSRLIDLQELLDTHEATELGADVPAVPLATGTIDGPEVSILDYAAGGLGITGPGAAAVLRGAAWSAVAADTTVVLDQELAEQLGLDLSILEAIPSVKLSAAGRDLAEAARRAAAALQYEPETDELHPNITVVITDRETAESLPSDLLNTETVYLLVHGTWSAARIDVAADGTPRETHLGDLDIGQIGRCYLLDKQTVNGMLADLVPDVADPAPESDPDEPDATSDPVPGVETAPAPVIETEPETDEELFQLQLFGEHQLLWRGEPVHFGRRSCLDLIAVMALVDNWTLDRDELTLVVAGDAPLTKASSRRTTAIQETRKALNACTGRDDLLVFDKGKEHYRLDDTLFHTDVSDFDRHIAEAENTNDAEQRAQHLTAALQHYTGPLGAELDEAWDVIDLRRRYQQTAWRAALDLAAHHQENARVDEAVALLERACAIDPEPDQAWTRLAALYQGQGDTVRADAVISKAAQRRSAHRDSGPRPPAIVQ
jgi:DNA-binding SARP family transcriptional activator